MFKKTYIGKHVMLFGVLKGCLCFYSNCGDSECKQLSRFQVYNSVSVTAQNGQNFWTSIVILNLLLSMQFLTPYMFCCFDPTSLRSTSCSKCLWHYFIEGRGM